MMSPTRKNKGFFITGTDTGVGKTLVSVAIVHALVARGLRTAVMKPVAAGAIHTPDGPRNDDALELSAASNVPAAYADVNPWLLSTPASPHLAARADGVSIRHETILASYGRLAARSDVLIVEGAGGWLAPTSATGTMADIAEVLALPVVLVVGMRLGCLNHALLTRDGIRARGLSFGGWIANELESRMPLCAENIDTLTTRFGVAPLAIVPTGSDAKSHPGKALPEWAIEAAKNLVSP
ncbi:MAG TPA: dethiobiotin synthase [Steroidobacteraceae bacterium]|nr:dethiobiotin synthase [Steroidobacteraceae bacterium]